MTRFLLQPESTAIPRVVARYQPADYALMVVPTMRSPEFRLSIDTLTLLFDSRNYTFLGLDAYTNSTLWNHQPLSLPPVDEEGSIVCIEPFDEHGIGASVSSPVQYSYSEETDILFIELGAQQVVKRIRCLSSVICGLDRDGELIELWVEGLQISSGGKENT